MKERGQGSGSPKREWAGGRGALLTLALLLGLSVPAPSQCVMCYRSAHAQNSTRAHAMNIGILILGAPPFLILAGFCAFVYKRNELTRDD